IHYIKSPCTPSFVTLFFQNIWKTENIYTGGIIEKGEIACPSTLLRACPVLVEKLNATVAHNDNSHIGS
ncbi:MAG: hypothetical protein ACYSTT_20790, partial [Planctomycetota bacterium]